MRFYFIAFTFLPDKKNPQTDRSISTERKK